MNLLYMGLESENWVLNLCNRIAEQGHNVTVFTQGSDKYVDVSLEKNITHYRIEYDDFFGNFLTKHIDKVKNEKFDFIMGSHFPSYYITDKLSNILKVPFGIMILDVPSDLIRKDESRHNMWKLAVCAFKNASKLIFNTEISRREFENWFDIKVPKENVIIYGIETKIADLIPEPIKKNQVISVSRLHRQKNNIIIPYALGQISNPIKYMIVGRNCGDAGRVLQACYENSIKFEYKQLVTEEEKWKLIKESKALIYPQNTPYIGGLSPLEAMYVGTVPIVSNLPIYHEIYRDFAEFFIPEDVDNLSVMTEYVLSRVLDDYTKHKMREYVVKNASTKVMAKKLIELIQNETKII